MSVTAFYPVMGARTWVQGQGQGQGFDLQGQGPTLRVIFFEDLFIYLKLIFLLF